MSCEGILIVSASSYRSRKVYSIYITNNITLDVEYFILKHSVALVLWSWNQKSIERKIIMISAGNKTFHVTKYCIMARAMNEICMDVRFVFLLRRCDAVQSSKWETMS